MDGSNWRPPPQEQASMDNGDWRHQLLPDSRHRIINKIMETLKRHLPCSGQDGLSELKKIAIRFEEKIYSAATSQSDYLRRISSKMLTMESKSQNNMANGMASNSMGKNPQDPASQNMQSQVHSQGQSLPNPMASNQASAQAQQQLMMENLQNTIASAGMQTSASLPSTLPPVNGLSQNSMANVVQNSNLQNISGISQNNPMGNSMVHGAASNLFTNPQKQMQGRQVGNPQQQMQQAQNPQQYMYQQHWQQQFLKQKLNQGNMQQPLIQPQMQHQQQSVIQNSSLMQPSMVSGLPQNQQSSMQQPAQSVPQQHQQSILRQQQAQQTQQGTVIHNQQAQMTQQTMLPAQQQQQHHLMGRQSAAPNMQQSQLMAPQNSIPDMQQQQQQQRLLGPQITLGGLSGQPQSNTQNFQQQMIGQQNLSNMHQQPMGPQSHAGMLASQQQVLGGQSSSSTMQMTQYPVHMMQQPKTSVQQQNPNASGLLPGSGQQSHPQQPLMPQVQSQTAQQLQQQLGLQQQPSSLQHNMQQRLQTPNSLLPQQNMIDHQKMFQSQRPPAEAPSTSLDSTAQTGSSGDWQEEVYQKHLKTSNRKFIAKANFFPT